MPYQANLKVRFGDIDEAGVVYYPRFLHYFHVALEEFFESCLGIDYPTVIKKHRVGFPTVHLQTDFMKPLLYGDAISVEVRVISLGRSSIQWGYRTFAGGETKARNEGSNITVCVNLDTFEKIEIPPWLRERLNKLMEDNCCLVSKASEHPESSHK
jgi:4-hydroxybenzoyl-CoA thioesterase